MPIGEKPDYELDDRVCARYHKLKKKMFDEAYAEKRTPNGISSTAMNIAWCQETKGQVELTPEAAEYLAKQI